MCVEAENRQSKRNKNELCLFGLRKRNKKRDVLLFIILYFCVERVFIEQKLEFY
jgi:hypothetical protein